MCLFFCFAGGEGFRVREALTAQAPPIPLLMWEGVDTVWRAGVGSVEGPA